MRFLDKEDYKRLVDLEKDWFGSTQEPSSDSEVLAALLFSAAVAVFPKESHKDIAELAIDFVGANYFLTPRFFSVALFLQQAAIDFDRNKQDE